MIRACAFLLLFFLTHASLFLLFPFSLRRFLICFVLYGGGNVMILYLLFHPRSQLLVTNRSRVAASGRPCVALTFDDGPSADNTRRLLQILKDKNVRATFFIIGQKAEEQPDLLKQICTAGHELGNHTYTHPSLFCFLSPQRLRQEIRKTQEVAARICGVTPRYFRSPVGLRHPLLGLYLQQAGLEYISWRLRAFDTFTQEPAAISSRILSSVAPGDVILLHDSEIAGVGRMLEALPGLIDSLHSRGFEFVMLG